jgi:cobyrinic acid a,c-diamide synthase
MIPAGEQRQYMERSLPRIVIAGTNSGVGKTSLTLALVSALRKRGLAVQTFKVGPDYLDPTYLSIASGRPCYNLDGWMAGKDHVCSLFHERAASADISVVEGVMGMFDGSDPVDPAGSTGEIAAWLQAPVLLVVNAHGMARSIAALVKGYAEFDPLVALRGVIANRCGSERHGHWLGESLRAFGLPPTVAWPVRGAFTALQSRHLGLVTADTRNLPHEALDSYAEALEQYANLDAIIEIARAAPVMPEIDPTVPFTNVEPIRLGLAFDEAFHFYYADNLEALEARGCKLVRFSPLTDAGLPADLDGIYFGGGYPEEHAAGLSRNDAMIRDVRDFVGSGRPVYAECGGLMYLCRGIELADGVRHELVGAVPHWTRMLPRLRTLGYAEVTVQQDSLFGPQGSVLRGHEFHYSELAEEPEWSNEVRPAYRTRRMRSDEQLFEGFQIGNVVASYVHVHFASRPHAVDHFVALCRKMRESHQRTP